MQLSHAKWLQRTWAAVSHLGSKVHDGVDLLRLEDMVDQVEALKVALDELQVTAKVRKASVCKLDKTPAPLPIHSLHRQDLALFI